MHRDSGDLGHGLLAGRGGLRRGVLSAPSAAGASFSSPFLASGAGVILIRPSQMRSPLCSTCAQRAATCAHQLLPPLQHPAPAHAAAQAYVNEAMPAQGAVGAVSGHYSAVSCSLQLPCKEACMHADPSLQPAPCAGRHGDDKQPERRRGLQRARTLKRWSGAMSTASATFCPSSQVTACRICTSSNVTGISSIFLPCAAAAAAVRVKIPVRTRRPTHHKGKKFRFPQASKLPQSLHCALRTCSTPAVVTQRAHGVLPFGMHAVPRRAGGFVRWAGVLQAADVAGAP